jgi:hypothetical protein
MACRIPVATPSARNTIVSSKKTKVALTNKTDKPRDGDDEKKECLDRREDISLQLGP